MNRNGMASKSPPAGAPAGRGFTLIELLTTVMVFAILVAVAVPTFRNISLNSKLSSTANNLMASIQLARSEAIKRNKPVTLCASANGTSCVSTSSPGWEQGWVVLDDAGNVLQVQEKAPLGYKVTQAGGTSSLTFQPIGVGATAATFTVCRADPVGSQERQVNVTATGVAYVTRTTTGACS